jgi:hypothetical protein
MKGSSFKRSIDIFQVAISLEVFHLLTTVQVQYIEE